MLFLQGGRPGALLHHRHGFNQAGLHVDLRPVLCIDLVVLATGRNLPAFIDELAFRFWLKPKIFALVNFLAADSEFTAPSS